MADSVTRCEFVFPRHCVYSWANCVACSMTVLYVCVHCRLPVGIRCKPLDLEVHLAAPLQGCFLMFIFTSNFGFMNVRTVGGLFILRI